MAEPFKNWLNANVVSGIAAHFHKHWRDFDSPGFIQAACQDLEALELKARSQQITRAMIIYLPDDFEQAAAILSASLGTPLAEDLSAGTIDENGIAGWAVMPLSYYVALQGKAHFDLSMQLLKQMTKRATAEFDIRFFLLESSDKTLAVLKNWAEDTNQHVRRLVSEGSRPRLPWGIRLPHYMADPGPVIELLQLLKDDESQYVRRSVANNLNDISKDHPELVAEIAERWMQGADKNRQRLIRHACRSLIKGGHKKALSVFGFHTPNIDAAKITLTAADLVLGDTLQFELCLSSVASIDQSLMIDYIIHHRKANGKTSPKVFKWRTATLAASDSWQSIKQHKIKKITTRRYYSGEHQLEVVVNGVSVGKKSFQLSVS